ncbi:MAG: 2OG-Fe(II) oxygenase [Gammaproteobacteria bacterium]|nr:2OG-Fe(II) oxygenase [Gammaproteobacteria bacterium]
MNNSKFNFATINKALNDQGYVVVPKLLSSQACAHAIGLYDKENIFRKKIVMARHGYGQGEYQYFKYPLPPWITTLRDEFYSMLRPIAEQWAMQLKLETHYPETLDSFLAHCCAQGQQRPTPLILKYGPGDYNRLHQDVYGEVAFPLQLAICLSQPGQDFQGGQFVLTQARARMQAQVEVVELEQGDGVVFANRYQPTQSVRGYARLNVRHGVSRIVSGSRYCLGIIFHDAN